MRKDGLSLSAEERRPCVGVEALAASQTAAGVETRTEPPFFEPGCPHHSEIIFRHTAVLFAVILHQSNRRGLCSCLASAHLLETLTLLGCYHQLCLQQESLNQQGAKDTTAKFLCNVISGSGAPATVCLLLDSWDIEQSLLGFLRDDCCLLNNLVQA